jgi:hypothetical protein
MKAIRISLALTLVCSLILAGCQTLSVIPHAVNCDVSAQLMADNCATPRPIANDATYATLVDTMQADRKALRECNVAADALRDAIKHCNQATSEYNKTIDALNRAK